MAFIAKFTYISELYNFVKAVQNCKHKVTVKQGDCVVSGASILGILSLDLFNQVSIFCSEEDFDKLKIVFNK